MGRQDVRVSLRALQCTVNLHQTIEAGDGPSQEERSAEHDFPGRHVAAGRIKAESGMVITGSLESPQTAWVPNQMGEIQPSAIPQVGGLEINTTLMTLTIPEEKVQRIQHGCQMALQTGCLTVRELSRLIGMMVVTTLAVLPAPLHYRELQRLKIDQLKVTQSFETRIPLNNEAKEELQWWSKMLNSWNGCPILPLTPDLIIETDASLLG